MKSPKFTVAVCGGGIGGVATALTIQQFSKDKNIKIDIYEAKEKFTEIGAGLGFSFRPWKIFKRFGLAKELEALLDYELHNFPPQQSLELRKADQELGATFYDMQLPNGTVGFHRAQFLEVLTRHLDPETVTPHFSKRLVSYKEPKESNGPAELVFADGTTASADVVIGCDGLHSPTRRSMLEYAAADIEASGKDGRAAQAEKLRKSIDPLWSGRATYRGVIPREKVEALLPNHRAARRPVLYSGKHKLVVTYPIANKTLINVSGVLFFEDKVMTPYDGKIVENRSQAELISHYEGWEEEVQVLLKCIESPSRWIIKQLDNLPICAHGRVALIGDAAHAMTPFLGAGAGAAVEDAYVLGAILANPLVTLKTLPQALKIYEEVRLPFANKIQRDSNACGDVLMFHDPRFSGLRGQARDDGETEVDQGKLWEIGHEFTELWKYAWTTDVEDEKDLAMTRLEQELGSR